MLILEYISTHATREWCAAQMSARESKTVFGGTQGRPIGPILKRLCSKHLSKYCEIHVFWNRINVLQCIVIVILVVQSEFHIHDDLYIFILHALFI